MILATVKSTKSAGSITADVNGQTVSVMCARGVNPAVNDVVIVAQIGSMWFALDAVDVTAPTPPGDTSTGPPPTVSTGALVVTPVETRSYRSGSATGWRTDDDDVYQGQYGGWGNHTGCVFFGTKPRALAGATVTGATFRVRMEQIGSYPAQAATMRLLTNTVRPGGAPTLQASTTTGPQLAQGVTEDRFPVPVAWAQAMVDGTAGGLAFYVASGSPYLRMAGRSSWSAAFTMTINWRRP
jgi:hypothetical protein